MADEKRKPVVGLYRYVRLVVLVFVIFSVFDALDGQPDGLRGLATFIGLIMGDLG